MSIAFSKCRRKKEAYGRAVVEGVEVGLGEGAVTKGSECADGAVAVGVVVSVDLAACCARAESHWEGESVTGEA
jgi:hypothetical protein